jgi:exonuclease VII small subunit
MTFEQAHQRLQEIHSLLSSQEELTLDQIKKLQEEAKLCYDKCHELLVQKND